MWSADNSLISLSAQLLIYDFVPGDSTTVDPTINPTLRNPHDQNPVYHVSNTLDPPHPFKPRLPPLPPSSSCTDLLPLVSSFSFAYRSTNSIHSFYSVIHHSQEEVMSTVQITNKKQGSLRNYRSQKTSLAPEISELERRRKI